MQLPLFDIDIELPLSRAESIAQIEWSHSKRSAMKRCLLSYYFTYYGANKTVARSEPRKAELHFLKDRVQNRYMFAGHVLHTVIKVYFKKAQDGEIFTLDRLVSWARHLYRESWNYSKQYHVDPSVSNEKYPPTLLKEYYDQNSTADELCEAEEARLLEAVHSFATNDKYKLFREMGIKEQSLIEHPLLITNLPCKATGVIDLAFRKDGGVFVIDWKLGKEDSAGDNSLQLAVYGLWAVEYFQCNPEQLQVCKVHLSSNEIIYFQANAKVLHDAQLRILQDAEQMASMDIYGRDGIAEVFTPCLQPRVCHSCIYEGICYDS